MSVTPTNKVASEGKNKHIFWGRDKFMVNHINIFSNVLTFGVVAKECGPD
jgi:hypothetical protein